MSGHKNPFRHEKRPMVTMLVAVLSVALFLSSWSVIWASHREGEAEAGGSGPTPAIAPTLTAVPSGASTGPTGTSVATATPTRTSRAS
ncbi:MAG: hypothetical protein AB7T37_12110 [Dehalococcoidia bacterium]